MTITLDHPNDAKLVELHRRRERLIARWNEGGSRGATEEQEVAFCDKLNRIDKAIAAKSAHGMTGLVVKAKVVSQDLNQGAGGCTEEIARSLLYDLERLAGGAL
ncbi:MAG: hypothetical protein GEU87_01350 [Alphaproteobacteria bacterium]|nr:hypothetical protein [Alphaproteobacteria bacterium]